ncbi:MAG: alkaline phosphatase D family protein [Hyphomonas sp.]|nr:alkaline phosphatase D family protein [Hyphomonas sp.]MCB9970789.1 alkaline phosphatase D family protein [Hyphomonas sp.]
MTSVTRRGLLGAAATGTLGLAACVTAPAKEAAYDGEVAFQHGVASGDPLADRVILWTRVTPTSGAGAIPVRYEVMDGAGTVVTSGMLSADAAHDYCVKADAAGLQPATTYTYRFKALTGAGEVASPTGRTRTTAIAGDAPVRLVVISCSNWQFGFFNAYAALSQEADVDAIVHLGDYIYEYGIDGYGGEVAQAIGRPHDPPTECITLSDYRRRHAQYKTDPNLQAAHAAAPWICTWDDHESANDSYRTGAENHNPDKGEGLWSDRKMAAVQAYFEWLPMREPEPGKVTTAVWRSFDFGDVATICALETRLTGRSPSISWFDALTGETTPEGMVAAAQATMAEASDPSRTMMGPEQEAWLEGELGRSVTAGKSWQVLANQVVMAKTVLPKLQETLTPEQIAAQDNAFVQQMIAFSALGLPANLDAWDGYPAARERLYASAAKTGARLVVLAGDTHTAWANTLHDKDGIRRAVEFGCTSITSPGSGSAVKDIPDLGAQMAAANADVDWHDPFGHGYTVVTFTPDAATAEYRKVSGILSPEWTLDTVSVWEAKLEDGGVSDLAQA